MRALGPGAFIRLSPLWDSLSRLTYILFVARGSLKMRWQFVITFASFASTLDVGVLKQLVKPFVSFSSSSFRRPAYPRTADVREYF